MLQEQRKEGLPTVPSSIEQEFNFNPFMRVEYVEICQSKWVPFFTCGLSSPLSSLPYHSSFLPLFSSITLVLCVIIKIFLQCSYICPNAYYLFVVVI